MNAPIVEVFSSIQGEGLLIGRRQIFVRFAGCNLNCNYCDSPESRDLSNGNILSVDEVVDKVKELITPDVHSISFTGGEPLLYVYFINEFLEKLDMKSLIETNGTFPNELNSLKNIDYVSIDIKLKEHFTNSWTDEIFENEIKSLKILMERNINIYCKLVVLPSTDLSHFENVVKDVGDKLQTKEIPLIIQPSSPIGTWKNHKDKLFKFLEIAGKYLDVLLIPQVHKYLDVE
ncbi:7-carboxy-7-deazaguanine synthase QueE [Methanobrevibacter filiformis]|uniref:7-carboxy-7-deazaguanine synthase n=1 Tax=Methanobrevibacter filiformis TaxID=55758 RepID=A0A166APE1_9EURY|nr:7-carboxy-7-deazaguanine synthase QueE [Methanobrevibacter filiformis]KZX12299.1 7-carboxy-7-deazaguanine synthase [Methanobrevibacter filiformis]